MLSKNHMKRTLNHLIIGFIFLILTLGQQYLFYYMKGIQIVWLSPIKYLALYLAFFMFSFIPGFKLRWILLSCFLILNFFQMAHLSFYGTQINPFEIFLFFTQMSEISGTLLTEFHHVFYPLLFTLIPLIIGYFSLKKIKPAFSWKYLIFIIAIYTLYNPARTYITGNNWGRTPSTREIDGMNMYLSLSYFSGRLLPGKILSKSKPNAANLSTTLKIDSANQTEWDNIIVVLGESLTPNHMSLYGYNRQTTPFLNELKNNPNFMAIRGLSSGVSSDVSITFFFNLTYGDAGIAKASKGDHCLFRLAKNKQFNTYFYSIQDDQSLRYTLPYICSSQIDDFKAMEQLSPETKNSNAASDRELIPKLADILSSNSEKKFIVLHQRGSHSPWELRYSKEAAIFSDPLWDKRINHYDNSVFEFDLFWKELHQFLSKTKEKILVVYLSDHGESLGVEGKYGHGFLAKTNFEIPLLFLSYNQPLPESIKKLPNYLPQYNLGLFLISQMGWNPSQNYLKPIEDFTVYGSDIDGFAGQVKISHKDEGSYDHELVTSK